MRVGELREILERFDDDDIVLLTDEEGENFHVVGDVTDGYFLSEDGDSGDFVDQEDVETDDKINLSGAVTAITIWP
jgi:hypothetical protein